MTNTCQAAYCYHDAPAGARFCPDCEQRIREAEERARERLRARKPVTAIRRADRYDS